MNKRFCPLLIVFILSLAVYAVTGFRFFEEMDPFAAAEDIFLVAEASETFSAADPAEEAVESAGAETSTDTDAASLVQDVSENVNEEQNMTDVPEAEQEIAPEQDSASGEEAPVETAVVEENTVEEEPEAPRELVIGRADPEYFSDALFIGDSRTVGLSEYCPELDALASFYAKTSLTVRQALDKPFVSTDDGKKTVYEMLATDRQYGKIYIMLGINEVGGGTNESFREDFREMIGRIRVMQPDAIIVIQGIMHVTKAKSARDPHINNSRIDGRNEAISELANPKMKIFYVDPNEAVDDDEGNLRAELSFDEVHLKAASYGLWYEYLLEHAVVWETDDTQDGGAEQTPVGED